MTTADLALAVASAIGLAQAVTLTLMYGLRSDWKSSAAGLVLLSSFTIKAVIYGMLVVGRLTGGLGIWPWVIAVALFDLVQMGWLVLVLREQRVLRRCPPPKPPEI